MKLRIGTRRSPLARAQTDLVRRLLEKSQWSLECEIVTLETTGDRVRDRPLREIGGKGLFVKELDEALRVGVIDCAVHSLKDVPSELAPDITLAAVPERVAVHDVWISRNPFDLAQAPPGTRVGTTSLRRSGQVLARNPAVRIGTLRGNVETRLARVREGECDATLLAVAGMLRLGTKLDGLYSRDLDPFEFVPAPGQGALGMTARRDDSEVLNLLAEISDPRSAAESTAERRVASALGGSCDLPLGAIARAEGSKVRLVGVVVAEDGTRILRQEAEGEISEAVSIGDHVAALLAADGAMELMSVSQAVR